MEPIAEEKLELAMQSQKGVISGAGNLFWHDIRWRPQCNVPVNEAGIMEIKQHSFKKASIQLQFQRARCFLRRYVLE